MGERSEHLAARLTPLPFLPQGSGVPSAPFGSCCRTVLAYILAKPSHDLDKQRFYRGDVAMSKTTNPSRTVAIPPKAVTRLPSLRVRVSLTAAFASVLAKRIVLSSTPADTRSWLRVLRRRDK